MRFTVHQASRQGGRDYNQDRVAYSYSRDALLMAVADGMGGHLHGEVAAQVAVQMLMEEFQKAARPALANPSGFLSRSLLGVHDAINEYAERNHLLESPRTTCVACVVQNQTAIWAYAGDSRLYLFREGEVMARTRDHSTVQQMIERGMLTEAEAAVHPDRNKIYNCLGGQILPEVSISQPVPLAENDTLLLCTDGFWSMISPEEMAATLRAYPLDRAVQHMMNHAEFRGGEGGDNLTLLAMTWGSQTVAPERSQVSTEGLALQEFTTRLARFDVARSEGDEAGVSDEDIERAIAEIQDAIKKHST
jgi:PPM family protein phosphatase